MITSDDIRFFLTVARGRTLVEAARTLNVTPSAITQRLRQLEERLQIRLIDRSARQLSLTNEGKLLESRGTRIIEDLSELDDRLRQRRDTVSGHLHVVAPFGFGRKYVAPVLSEFQSLHPDATATLSLAESPFSLADRSWDLMVHIGDLRNSSLIAQFLAPNERYVCASPAYVAERGAPRGAEDLRGHQCLALRENDEDVTLWRFEFEGHAKNVRVRPSASSNDGNIVHDWAKAGRGIIVRSEWDVADDLADGSLVRLLGDHRVQSADVKLLFSKRSKNTARTRTFADMLKMALTPPPWRL